MGYIIDGVIQAILIIVSLNPEVVGIASLSIEVSGAATILAALVGIPLGTFITLKEFPLKGLVKTVIYTLMGLPPVVAGLFVFLMISRAGPLGTFGLLFTPTAMIIAQFLLVLLTTAIVLETRNGDYSMSIALGIILLSLSFIINLALNLIQGESNDHHREPLHYPASPH